MVTAGDVVDYHNDLRTLYEQVGDLEGFGYPQLVRTYHSKEQSFIALNDLLGRIIRDDGGEPYTHGDMDIRLETHGDALNKPEWFTLAKRSEDVVSILDGEFEDVRPDPEAPSIGRYDRTRVLDCRERITRDMEAVRGGRPGDDGISASTESTFKNVYGLEP